MKIKFEADDGKLFNTEQEALAQDNKIRALTAIKKTFMPDLFDSQSNINLTLEDIAGNGCNIDEETRASQREELASFIAEIILDKRDSLESIIGEFKRGKVKEYLIADFR